MFLIMDAAMLKLDKNLTPNLIAALVIAASFFVPTAWQPILRNVGLFALSGALTNWLAVHMLFERVPGLYGSGIIPLNFEKFKSSLKHLVTEQLFHKDTVERSLGNREGEESAPMDWKPVVDQVDFDAAFDKLIEVIMSSSFGGMLGMVGGASAIEPLRPKFKEQMAKHLLNTVQSEAFQKAFAAHMRSMASSDAFLEKIDHIVQARLDELTPEMVKEIVKRMIKEHLGWLVVWGGVFGGLIGLITALVF